MWAHTALAEAEDALVIPELGLTLTLAEVHEKVGVAPLKIEQLGFETDNL